MDLFRVLQRRADAGDPVRVGIIGCGKFASMYLAQAWRTPGIHVQAVADLDVGRARDNLARVGWSAERFGASSPADALATGATHVGDDAAAVIEAPGLDVIVEATGSTDAGCRHALGAIANGRHLVMVNVETDVLVGPLLARRAQAAGLVYSLAYGDQPALICELVDWARLCGFEVVCAGKGTRYMPHFHQSTPATVWRHFGISDEEAVAAGMNPKMFNSFIDGTKSAIEMAAVANATGLVPMADGLHFPPCCRSDLPHVLRPTHIGGHLNRSGTVEVVTDLERDGRPVHDDLRMGVYVTFAADGDYARRCLGEYHVITDGTGETAALYRTHHLIGLELGISVARVALKGEATGAPEAFVGDVVATAKRSLAEGDMLDGEGGTTVFGSLRKAEDSLAGGGLPIGLAHNIKLRRNVAAGHLVTFADVEVDQANPALRLRRDMERTIAADRTD